ncbi:ATP-dependent DNA helicase [Halalkalicoccus jeotgali]|uniref:Helicase n=1 Tax=Halalkalicoccus jeotgali (strain DSM 18796 / CECT 7217 / JCM 14584 / KCTC 4019 / B3) TaxID=795797 RepID=D8J400_HALJB|nr:ATP-dependent DNA helicase [Halalkalicoccus jeotgali]ADJ15392.1 helicase [Halalkalicoccus jeotgali B3]ELY35832.1 helicase [Halalkalicoccus jeotgali B3]
MPAWQEIFGHDEPYESQAEGIETAVETAEQQGFTVLEGACGTGKTMLALTAGIDRVRDPDSDYERVVVLTSVKQQLRQFETDLETINANLPADWNPISGLTLVGKADVCPYSRENAGGIDRENVYDRCETLREKTRTLVGDGGATSASALTAQARSQQIGLADSTSEPGGGEFLETAGEPTPYPSSLPEYEDGGETEFCPFYAQYLDDLPDDGDAIEAVPFDLTEQGHLTPEELVGLAASSGTCPHSIMGALIPEVDVVVGNYYHAFDPLTTGSFTGALLDDATFLICDEAHMLEPRVRDLVSDGVADTTLRDAENELTRVIQAAEMGERAPADGDATADTRLVREELEDSDVTLAECKELRAFLADLREELDRRVEAHLDREQPGWKAALTALSDDELPLRDPETPGPDAITEWAEEAGYDGGTWVRAQSVGAIVERILDTAEDEERTRAAPAVGRLLGSWYRADHERYFREIELERTWNELEPEDSWKRAYSARLSLFNCVPSDAIGERLAEFGGGVLMSATLEPLDVFREVTGLDTLAEEGRPVVERTFPLEFPTENRASFAVDAPKFTYGNRGSPTEGGSTRRLYGDLLVEVAASPGNVLVGMPNYAEATWAAGELESRVEKPVLLDESSGDGETEELKHAFFAGEDKVLVTSLRGTLTEGVDYSGDRLSAAVICGVPIINTASPRTKAVRTAYNRAFGDGFEYALTVPAVRKARQAIGRVIRGPEEVGVRVLLDARYARESWDGVRKHFPDSEREEFQPVSSDMLGFGLERFWKRH